MNDGNDYNAPTAVWKPRTTRPQRTNWRMAAKKAVAATILMLMMIDSHHGNAWDVMDTDANNSWISIYGHRGI